MESIDNPLRETLRKIMEAHRFNVASLTVTEVHALCFDALTAKASGLVLPPSPYMPGVDPAQLSDYERGEAQGRCDMWVEVAHLNSSPVSAGEAVIDLDAAAWTQIKEAASQSAWMPEQYFMNDWVSDVCAFLRELRTVSAPSHSEQVREADDEPFSCEHAACKSLGQHHPLCAGYKLIKAEAAALSAPSHSEQVREVPTVAYALTLSGQYKDVALDSPGHWDVLIKHGAKLVELVPRAAPSAGSQEQGE